MANTTFPENDPIPTNSVQMWSGAIADIPDGWVLCDGNNGTPDLRDKFVAGASDGDGKYAQDATGGADDVALATGEMPAHDHPTMDAGHAHGTTENGHAHTQQALETTGSGKTMPDLRSDGDTTQNASATATEVTGLTVDNATTGLAVGSAGSGNSHENRPQFYALAYIMKE